MFKYKFTVMTPTFNRAHLLPRLYESIKRQTYRDFEWLIVDDGSTDNTKEVVDSFIADNTPFPIRYYLKENGGKSRAVNYGLDLAEGELFFIMDSDDYLTDNALERLVYWFGTIEGDKRFCGVAGERGITETETPNIPLRGTYEDVSALDKYRGNKALDGEHAECFYTDIFRKFKYPEFEGEKYMTPGVAFNRMAAAGYMTRYFSDIIWVCKYLDDGLTKQALGKKDSIYVRNPRGYGLFISERNKFIGIDPIKKYKSYYGFYCEFAEKYDCKAIASFVNESVLPFLIYKLFYNFKRKTEKK